MTKPANDIRPATFTGNRALRIEEPLIFETGAPDRSGVDIEVPEGENRLGGLVAPAEHRQRFDIGQRVDADLVDNPLHVMIQSMAGHVIKDASAKL